MTDPLRVVLVDDSEKLRALFRLALEMTSAARIVGEANDGEEGIAVAARERPDVVLLDLSMPTMDGFEALPRIRAASPESHVVVLTGFKRERLEDVAFKLGATAFLEKGIAPTQLATRLAEIAAVPPTPAPALDAQRQAALAARVKELI